jgi:hypothetical protein
MSKSIIKNTKSDYLKNKNNKNKVKVKKQRSYKKYYETTGIQTIGLNDAGIQT